MKKITNKLAIFFIFIICISSIISFFTSIFFNYDIENEIKSEQENIALTILELMKKTDLSIDEIASISTTSMYEVSRIENIDCINLSREGLKKINDNGITFLTQGKYAGTTTILKVDETFIKISLHPRNTIFKIVVSRIWFTLTSYVFIGTFLIILLARIVVKPVLKLNEAVQEVAKGNFDVQVENSSDDEVGQLTQNFNKMTKELKNIEYLRKDFITNVSHEFKTPIASIQGFAKLLKSENITKEEIQEYSSIIVEETQRLSNLTTNILKLSKLENQEIVEKKTRFSLDEQIRKSILVLEHEWSKKNIEFDIELDKVDYLGDEELLQQVWLNILANAIKFSNINGKVDVSLKKGASSIIVKITDYGIGMSKETQKRIFEKFYQGERSRSHEGSGLGLALVKRILDLYDSSISVESEPNKGSSFTVELSL
ncbi:sensor histidine kinase [Proteiniborus sp. DW1]|uniref:sensor histidine kinase n=1 Tax=Proteiniborus sp. DW1 TaxID=1889883 RepID=UPI00092DF4A2|nr:HAMP domain-containing sensor histidine kinase [Proteiniborus sp. DW1]SCG83814.1 sensor histidine kinase [Proteiniborus sp. DW1]